MRKRLAIIIAFLAWFAVIAQFILMLQNRTASVPETIVHFFSFFTILTNTIVALFLTGRSLHVSITNKPGILTAVSVYIFIVGIVYQFLLRHIWQPTGLQLVVDELLHTINPLGVMIYWFLYEKKQLLKYSYIKGWMIYPVAYLVYILIRGNVSGFYPYPFVDVTKIGYPKTLLNSALLTLFFLLVAVATIAVGRRMKKKGLLPT